jgi:cytosine/adenosine deaminase-related metal-dependent hydrolase
LFAVMKLYCARQLLPISGPAIEDGALVVQGGRIVAVGRRSDLTAAHPRAAVVDFADAVLLPPLVNAHTHLELTGFPDWAAVVGQTRNHRTFVDWILHLIQVKRALPQEAFVASLADGIRRSLAAGTGAVGDIVSYLPARKAYARSPIRGRIFLEVVGRDPGRWKPLLQKVAKSLAETPVGRMQLGLSPHSPYTLSEEFLVRACDLSRQTEVPLTIHLAEAPDETDFLATASGPLVERLYPGVGWGDLVPPPAGRSPLAYLASCGGLGPNTLLVHGVQVGTDEAGMIAESGASLVLCPRSNARLDVGQAPAAAFLAAGINLALGTDSMASNDSLSVWDEIAFARDWFAQALSPAQLLHMATLGGARALGLEGELGALAIGWGANFQVLLPPQRLPAADLVDGLTGGGGGAVQHLFLGGKDVLQPAA